MKRYHLLLLLLGIFLCPLQMLAQTGTPLNDTEADALMQQCATRFPKFYREFKDIQKRDTLIKKIILVRDGNMGGGPAKAGPRGNVFIDVKYLENQQPDFDDNRLVVVLYHEIGHLHYFSVTPRAQRNPIQSEKAAFEYSLLKTKEMAEAGDCLPLKTGLKFMKLRSEGTNLRDPHVQALKLMVNEPLYAGYLEYVGRKCG